MDFYEWVLIISMAVGISVGVIGYRLLPTDMRYIFYMLLATLLLEIAADFQMLVYHKNNLVYYHLMTLEQYVFLSLFLRENISFLKTKKVILVSIVLFIAVEAVLAMTVQNIRQSPSWIRLVTRLALLYYILFYLKSLLEKTEYQPLVSLSSFWICIGIMMYFLSFLQVGLMQYLIKTNLEMALVWYKFSIGLDVLFYLLCGYSIYISVFRPYRS